MSNNEFGLKELDNLTLKATLPIELQGRKFDIGEVVARFDKIQIANFKEISKKISAKGGFDNRALILWENTEGIQIDFTQGIFSTMQFALLNNSHLLQKKENQCLLVPQTFFGESNEEGIIDLNKKEISSVFVYNRKTYEKITPKSINQKEGTIEILEPYLDVVVDFIYCYKDPTVLCVIGKKLLNGFLTLEGQAKIKDDITGQVKTALLKVPHFKLTSDLMLSLGKEAYPILARFSGVGMPVGARGNQRVMEMAFLSDDINADIQ